MLLEELPPAPIGTQDFHRLFVKLAIRSHKHMIISGSSLQMKFFGALEIGSSKLLGWDISQGAYILISFLPWYTDSLDSYTGCKSYWFINSEVLYDALKVG